jgi:hypothetical protein
VVPLAQIRALVALVVLAKTRRLLARGVPVALVLSSSTSTVRRWIMATTARIENGVVMEILTADPFPPFHEALVWVDCSTVAGVVEGWTYDGTTFTAPIMPTLTITQQIAPLQAQIDAMDGGKQARQVRVMLIALGGGDATSLAKLQALEAAIEATGLRQQIKALQDQIN